MKLIILAAVFAFASGDKLNRAYLPPNFAQTSGGSSEFLQTPLIISQNNEVFRNQDNQNSAYDFGSDNSKFVNLRHPEESSFDRPERPRASFERNAAILRQTNENNGETYSYAFETENGIVAEENGDATNGVEAQGSYSYTGDDGQVYSVRYTAGQNGFLPEGDHLPTPPPIPQEILMALEQNARDEAAGIFDDGSYRGENYSSGNRNYEASSFGQNGAPTNSNDDSIVINSAFNSDASQASGFGARAYRPDLKDDGVTKAYLPPTEQRLAGNRNSVSRYGNTRRPSYSARSGYNY